MSIKISIHSAPVHESVADLVVVGVWASGSDKSKAKTPSTKPAQAPKWSIDLDRALGGGLAKAIAKEEFTGKKDQSLTFPTLGHLPSDKIIIMGLGEKGAMTNGDARTFAAKAARAAIGEKAKSLAIGLPEGLDARMRSLAEGVELGAYRFTKYFTGDRKPKAELTEVILVAATKASVASKREIEIGQSIASAVNLSRDLSNEPPNVLTPAALATAAQKMSKENGLKITVFDLKEIKSRGMLLLQAVGQGSVHEPRFVHMTYMPAKKSKKRIIFVGKGVTFDSGGISIKPAAGMGEMKHDMSGAANVVGLMAAVAATKPNVEVHGIFAAAENMPDGNAYRPGDVWGSLDGKSVEIINTDAEGRLILADALAFANALKPDLLIDNATLTGACVVALGNTCSAFYATNDATAREYQAALKGSGEQMWRMPMLEELREQLKSDVADLKHTGDRWGGSITAALFLREFIGETKNWVHADIAGPAMADRASGWNPKGATGHGVLTFLSLVENASR